MAQGDGVLYNEFKRAMLAGEIDLSGHDIKVALVSGYTPNIDTHHGWADVSANECSGAGYSAGGAALASLAVTADDTNDRGVFDAANVTWTSLQLAQTPSHAIVYDDTHASNILIAHFVVTTVTTGEDYTLSWNTSGICRI